MTSTTSDDFGRCEFAANYLHRTGMVSPRRCVLKSDHEGSHQLELLDGRQKMITRKENASD